MGTISLKKVHKAFGASVIIPSADLDIKNGEFVVFDGFVVGVWYVVGGVGDWVADGGVVVSGDGGCWFDVCGVVFGVGWSLSL